MSVIDNPLLLGQEGGAGYSIPRSLRFNSSDSGYCSRVPSTVGNRRTFTWAGWVKRSGLSAAGYKHLFSTGTVLSEAGYFGISFWEDKLDVTTGAADLRKTSAVYRDTSAWYHIVVAVDTTQATAANRVKVYVNGAEVTAFSTNANPTQNADLAVNNTGAHAIGRNSYNSSDYFDGYLADVHLVDGAALDPTSFGEFDTNGIWQPKAYTGTYGTNGFHLDFADNSAATATTLGKDTSGNGNNWTPNNLSVTAGAGNDSLVDSPTNGTASSGGDAGGVVVGNYATFNNLLNTAFTYSDGNLQISGTSPGALSTICPSSGKWYAEFTYTAIGSAAAGVVVSNLLSSSGAAGLTQTWQLGYQSQGKLETAGSQSNVSSFTTNDVIGVAFDCATGAATFYKNGVSVGTATSTAFANVPVGIGVAAGGIPGTCTAIANFGQRPFAYAAPAGFKSLNTANLPTPTILKGSSYFDTKLYTGNGSTQTISGLGFSPDWVWVKERSTGATSHHLVDQVRGADKYLLTNATDAEYTGLGRLTGFTSDGFTVASVLSSSSQTYAAWCWDAGSSTVTNTAGSISAQVRANASAGFSVVTYTGTGANATVGHGLGVAPGLIICKSRSGAFNWQVYHSTFAGTSNTIVLNSTGAVDTGGGGVWNSTAPTSTVFSIGTSVGVNTNGNSHVAYCFAPVAGYSAFGSYTGNGSADGPFVYCGFRPRWVMIKRTDTANSWVIYDTARGTYNANDYRLYPNLSNAEGANEGAYIDFISNGFKPRNTDGQNNASGGTYIYAAFAENPFSIARAR